MGKGFHSHTLNQSNATLLHPSVTEARHQLIIVGIWFVLVHEFFQLFLKTTIACLPLRLASRQDVYNTFPLKQKYPIGRVRLKVL